MRTPNYHDFYEKAFIPIGSNDLEILQNSSAFDLNAAYTHWLIAVEGVQLPQSKIFYNWKVSIYPATEEREFNWKAPFYCSSHYELMDHAIKLAAELSESSKKDKLSSTTLLEKIS